MIETILNGVLSTLCYFVENNIELIALFVVGGIFCGLRDVCWANR